MIRKLIKLVLILGTIACPFIIALGFMGALHPALDTFANFRFHAALACIALAICWAIARQWRVALSLCLIGLFALSKTVVGLPANSQAMQNNPFDSSYTLLHFNVLYDNPDKNAVSDLVAKYDPDIFLGIELSTIWSDHIFRWKEKYPHVYHCPEWQGRGGNYVFSKFPTSGDEDYCHAYAALGLKHFEIEGKKIQLGSVHLRWPWPASQPRQLRELRPALRTISKDALVVGDFNAATWTHAVSSFAKDGGLTIVSNIGPTWLFKLAPDFARPLLGLPIDNVMQKGVVNVLDVKRLGATGSDHLPLLVRFSLEK